MCPCVADIWRKPRCRDTRPRPLQHFHSGTLYSDQPTVLVPEWDEGGHLPESWGVGLCTPRYKRPLAGNSFLHSYSYKYLIKVTHVSHFTDPNSIYPWQTEPTESKDKLDFRHHNYKEMRKVFVLYPEHFNVCVVCLVWPKANIQRFHSVEWTVLPLRAVWIWRSENKQPKQTQVHLPQT